MTYTDTELAAATTRFPNFARYAPVTQAHLVNALYQDGDLEGTQDEADDRPAHRIAERLLANAVAAKGATEKQLAFITKLAAERGVPATAELTKAGASAEIERLLALPKATRQAAPQAVPVTDGFYSFEGDIIKVQEARNGSGRVYAKRLDAETGSFEFQSGLVRKLTADMKLTAEQAKAYGHLYGRCCCCGRDLTDEVSIEAGVGPVCKVKYGF